MDHNISIQYKGIELRPMTIEDSELYRKIRNLEEKRKWFKNTNYIGSHEQREWFKKYLHAEKEYMFSVYINENDYIGGIAIYNLDLNQKKAEIGRFLLDIKGKKHSGLGKYVVAAVSEVAINCFDLKKLYLEVYCENNVACEVYKKAGFRIVKDNMDEAGNKMYIMEKDL